MILLRQINADIKQGILQKWKLFLITLIVALGLTILFLITQNGSITKGRVTGTASLGDVLYYMFRGMEEYNPKSKIPFDIVDSFLIWNLMLAFMISYYPVRELRNTGKTYLVRANTRRQWWLSKCVWNSLTVCLFYLCIFAGMVLGTLIASSFLNQVATASFLFNPDIFKRVLKEELIGGAQQYILIQILILPFAASLAISMFQMAVEFIFNEPISYIAVIVLCAFSAYYMKWFLVGNSMMVYRYNYVNPKGIGIFLPLLASSIFFLVSIMAGYISFRNKDIL